MDDGYKKKLVASALTIALVFSSLIFLAGAQAGAGDDLEVSNLYETEGSPPPRANVPYGIVVGWKNFGDTASYDATVRLYSDCSQTDLEDESASITMGPDESGSVILNATFEDAGEEICYSATIYHDSTDYGEFENYINVEPEIGDALLWVEFDMEMDQAGQGQDVDVVFTYGNEGNVSTLNPVTFMAYFNKWDDETLHSNDSFAPSPLTYGFISPPPPGESPPEQMQWQYTIPPQTKDGRYKFTVIIDSEENNTEDPDLADNVAVWGMCIGDCSEPDLKVWDNGLDSIRAEPFDAVAGTEVSFRYSVENIGEGDANPPQGPGSPEFVMHLEVMKCPATEAEPGGDCGDQEWENGDGMYINKSKAVKTPIEGIGGDPPNNVFTSDDILSLVWSTTANDAGFWNVRVIVDAGDGWGEGKGVINETNEGNNNLDWLKVYSAYFELKEQRPDLTIGDIDEGPDAVYQGDETTIKVVVSQTALADRMADDVDVFIKIKDPDGDETLWFKIDDSKTVGLDMPTIFEYQWEPEKLGWYEFFAWVDMEDTILEWPKTSDGGEDGTNNQFGYDGAYKGILVYEKLPDLQVTSISVSPLNDNGQAMVGVSSSITATIANLGVRDMKSSEGSMLEVVFELRYPVIKSLATINVDQSLAMDETVNVTIPITFTENAQYRIQVKVDYRAGDQNGLIVEADEGNNDMYKNIYAASAMDAYVSDLDVPDNGNNGLAGKEYPITFVLGMSNLPDEGTYRLNFTVLVDGTFGFGEVLALSMENTTVIGDPAGSCSGKNITVKDNKEYCAIGTGYQISGFSAFIDFDSSYNQQTVVLPWIPNAQRSDNYNVTVEVSSDINVVPENDTATFPISIEKLTTNLLVESIKVTNADGSATIKVTVGYPQGEQAELDEVFVGLEVYRASDYENDENPSPVDTLTFKPVSLLKGDSRPVSFTWAVKNGDYIFVAIVDPEDKIREINELDNSFPSLVITFGDTTASGPAEEEDDGLFGLPAPSLVVVIGMFGLVALARRRS